jgi:opacity protein-like surface antigen
MRKTLLAACLLSSFVATAGAQSSEATYSPQGLRPFIGVGLAAGGDTLLRVQDTVEGSNTGKQSNIRAGDGLDLRLGLSLRLGNLPLSLQTAVAYHNDQTNGIDNTKYRFRRVPVEATLLWHATDRARIGFGVRKSTQPTVKIDNGRPVGSNTRFDAKYDMKASAGFIVEGEYAVTPGWSLKGRYVYETFRYKDFPEEGKSKGDHLAIQSVWYLL